MMQSNMGEVCKTHLVPTAPYDFELDERLPLPDLLTYLYNGVAMGDQLLTKAIVDYITNIAGNEIPVHADECNCPCLYMVCLKLEGPLAQEDCGLNASSSACAEDMSFIENPTDDVSEGKDTEYSMDKQKAKYLKRKRIRTLTEESEPTSTEEEVSPTSTPRQQRKKKQIKRKVIKGVAYTAWALVPPVMLGLNLLRGSNDYDDEDDKYDDPLRPWNYKINYCRPHKR